MANKEFIDENFRLACLDILLAGGHFREELAEILATPNYEDGWEVNPIRMKAFRDLLITQDLLDQITTFAPDGGDDIYFHVFPEWGGEEDELYIRSFADLTLLRNLERISVFAVADEGAFDLSNLCSLKHLKTVETHYFYVSTLCDIDATVDMLQQRGVEVTIRGKRNKE